ncbi:hypothetical protein [uncultured Alistipes sp.]|jgi:hypothetical protein|uniref:hypothetical protein n=1 Tax=uncultured Alistipes sp. TaxID=538949 RepID=UPI0027D98779|nr:hypothetical protein [uncultured Alistipes sp.]
MKTVQTIFAETVVQFCAVRAIPSSHKITLERLCKQSGLVPDEFYKGVLSMLYDVQEHVENELRQRYFQEHAYPVKWDDEFDEPLVDPDELLNRARDFQKWLNSEDATCLVTLQDLLDDIDISVAPIGRISFPQISMDIERFKNLVYPNEYFHVKDWSEAQLAALCDALIRAGFIAADTKTENFVWVFSGGPRADDWERVKWIKRSSPKGLKEKQYNKKSLLELLRLLGVSEGELRNRKLICVLFSNPDGSPLNYTPSNYQDLEKHSVCYGKLEEIVLAVKPSS